MTRKAEPGERVASWFRAVPGREAGKAWNAEKERRIGAFLLGTEARISGSWPVIVFWRVRDGPWSLGSTTPLLRPAGACRASGVIATALAAETPRRPSGGNHRNDAPHWLRGCSSCEDHCYGAHHWPWGHGAGHFGQERGYSSSRFAVTMVTSRLVFATLKTVLLPGI